MVLFIQNGYSACWCRKTILNRQCKRGYWGRERLRPLLHSLNHDPVFSYQKQYDSFSIWKVLDVRSVNWAWHQGLWQSGLFVTETGRESRQLQDILLADMKIDAVVVEMPLLNLHSPRICGVCVCVCLSLSSLHTHHYSPPHTDLALGLDASLSSIHLFSLSHVS